MQRRQRLAEAAILASHSGAQDLSPVLDELGSESTGELFQKVFLNETSKLNSCGCRFYLQITLDCVGMRRRSSLGTVGATEWIRGEPQCGCWPGLTGAGRVIRALERGTLAEGRWGGSVYFSPHFFPQKTLC